MEVIFGCTFFFLLSGCILLLKLFLVAGFFFFFALAGEDSDSVVATYCCQLTVATLFLSNLPTVTGVVRIRRISH